MCHCLGFGWYVKKTAHMIWGGDLIEDGLKSWA